MIHRPRHPLIRLLEKPRLRVLGINSGTSIDGLDLALVEIDGLPAPGRVHLLDTCSFRYPRGLHHVLKEIAGARTVDKEHVASTHFSFSEWTAQRVLEFAEGRARSSPIDLVGFHGQTIGHYPGVGSAAKGLTRATWQLGSGSVVAQRTGILTVSDFRTADIAAGGQGAPLSGYYHYLLFGARYVLLNLGGIANISVARRKRSRLEILAFDVGPGNMMSDLLTQTLLGRAFDPGGRIASSGAVDLRLSRRVLSDPYFRRRPPKTCGREEFGRASVERWFLHNRSARPADLLATSLYITVNAIRRAVQRWVEPFTRSRLLIITGGGVGNLTLVRFLAELLPGWSISVSDTLGFPAQYVEPSGFAVLAHETLHGRDGNLGGATGGDPACLGVISLP